MKTFKLEDCNMEVVLPEEYLTLGQFKTIKKLALEMKKEGKLDDKGNMIDIDQEEWTVAAISRLCGDGIDLNKMPLSPKNNETVQQICNHFAFLMMNSQKLGNAIVDEVEQKKEESVATKKAGRPRLNKN